MFTKPKDRRVAIVLAFAGAVLPISGLHKFYLGQRGWGVVYLLLSLPWFPNPIPRIASVMEGVWLMLQRADEFDRRFNGAASVRSSAQPAAGNSTEAATIAEALRQLNQLRDDGLISEQEFEQKRQQLLDRMG